MNSNNEIETIYSDIKSNDLNSKKCLKGYDEISTLLKKYNDWTYFPSIFFL